MDKSYLDTILTTEDRTPHWLSKKIGCSHTLVYKWLNGKIKISANYQLKINKLFGLGGSSHDHYDKERLS